MLMRFISCLFVHGDVNRLRSFFNNFNFKNKFLKWFCSFENHHCFCFFGWVVNKLTPLRLEAEFCLKLLTDVLTKSIQLTTGAKKGGLLFSLTSSPRARVIPVEFFQIQAPARFESPRTQYTTAHAHASSNQQEVLIRKSKSSDKKQFVCSVIASWFSKKGS